MTANYRFEYQSLKQLLGQNVWIPLTPRFGFHKSLFAVDVVLCTLFARDVCGSAQLTGRLDRRDLHEVAWKLWADVCYRAEQTRLDIAKPGSLLAQDFTSMCFDLTSSAFGTETFKTPSVNLASMASSFTSEGSGKTRRNSP